MVAAEAAACGALPGRRAPLRASARSPRTLAEAVPEAARGVAVLRGRPRRGRASSPTGSSGWLEAPEDLRAATREAIVAATRERYSWDGVARTVIAAAQGELDDLPEP